MMNIVSKNSLNQKCVRLLAPMALAASMLMPWSGAQAVPVASDVAITGTAGFIDSWAFATDVNQTGSYSVTQGGATTTNTVSGTAVSGTNPIAAGLTQTGDGFGIAANIDSTTLGGESDFPVGVDFSIGNNSASSIYKITLQFDYSHSVSASGSDAFAMSEYSLFDNTNSLNLFFRGVTSDTVFGDLQNGTDLGTFGNTVTDSGSALLELILNPGDLLNLTLSYDLSSGIYSDVSSVAARFDSFLSIANVEKVEVGAVPAPATLALLLTGVFGLMVSRRRLQ